MISILSDDRGEQMLISLHMTEGEGKRFPEMGKNSASDGTEAGARLPAWQSPLLAGSQAPYPSFRPHGQNPSLYCSGSPRRAGRGGGLLVLPRAIDETDSAGGSGIRPYK